MSLDGCDEVFLASFIFLFMCIVHEVAHKPTYLQCETVVKVFLSKSKYIHSSNIRNSVLNGNQAQDQFD